MRRCDSPTALPSISSIGLMEWQQAATLRISVRFCYTRPERKWHMVKYFCDSCGIDIKNNSDMMDLSLTTRNIPDLTGFYMCEEVKIDLLCKDCCNEIVKLVKDFKLSN